MDTKRIDLWKYPHMTYKKAFIYAAIISVLLVGLAFLGFSDYIRSHITGPLHVTLLTEQEATQVVEEVKQQALEEQQQHRETAVTKPAESAGGAGSGGQSGTSSVPVKSHISPTHEKASAGESGTVRQSSVGTDSGSGLWGAEGPGIGFAKDGDGEGTGDETGDGGNTSGNGGGYFSAAGYQENLQAHVEGTYPSQALRMGITGTVMLNVTFDANGDVVDVEVESSDNSILTKHAVKAAWSVGGAENSTGESHTVRVPVRYTFN